MVVDNNFHNNWSFGFTLDSLFTTIHAHLFDVGENYLEMAD